MMGRQQNDQAKPFFEFAWRIGSRVRGTKPPPQFGQSTQKVHS